MYVLVVNEHGISWILKKILGFARENSNWFMAYFFILNLKKNGQFGKFLKIWSLRSNSVARQVNSYRTKIDGKCQNWKTLMKQHFE